MRGRSSLLGFVMTAVVAVPSAAFVMQQTLAGGPEHRMELTSSAGALSITNSREGQAILTATPMVPGTSTSGMVALENSGDSPEQLRLDAGNPVDTPGPGGGQLSQRLRLKVQDISTSTPSTVYDGSLTGLHMADLGTLAKNESRTYRFVVTFPDGGANGADNAYQGSSTTIGFEWLIGEGSTTPPASAPLDQQVASDGPLAYWPLDGSQSSMTDATGSHPGTYTTTVVTATGTTPGGGQGAQFDGSAAYGYVNGVAAPQNAYTMEAWVKPANGSDMTVLEHGAAGALTIENGKFVLRHLDSVVRSNVAATPGVWHQVVATWDASTGVARLFVDGEVAAEGAVDGVPTGTATFYVGRGNTVSDSFFAGAIAQVSYYGEALAGDRVRAHWLSGRVPTTTPPTDPGTTDPGTTDPGTTDPGTTDPGTTDPGTSTPSDPGTPSTSTPSTPAPSTGGDTTGSQPTTTTPPFDNDCPGAVNAAGGQTSMWAVLNARAKARAKAKAKKLAKAKAKKRAKARGKTRGKARAAQKKKTSERSTCAGARAKKSTRSG